MEKAEKLSGADFVHLHNHTQYSLLDGLTKVPALVERVNKLGMDAVAVTDHGTMSGTIEFYKAAKIAGVKPIIGMEAYIAPRGLEDKDPAKDRQYFHLTVLAKNLAGYKNLMKLSTIANLEGFYYRPRIDRETLKKYREGLIVLSGCIGGEVGESLRQGQLDQAKNAAQWYKDVFGEDYYIELMDHGHPAHPKVWQEQHDVNKHLLEISADLNIPAVITCDAHYLMHEDQEAHEILLCVQTGAFLSDDQRFSLKDFELHVADPKDIIKRWGKTHPELIKNTKVIADKCQLEIELDKILIPKYPMSNDENEKELFHQLVWSGLAWRYGDLSRQEATALTVSKAKKILPPEIISRAEMELEVIDKVGYNGFFLIVNDFVNWGKDQGIVFGPGRGSTAGSIVAYALRITDLDPLNYDLLFERFLTPDRVSMPDMDIDIQDSRRDEVIEYCVQKYGRDRVSNIVTFGRMAARNSVRDVARVLQVPYSEADRLAKMIPPPIQGRHMPLAKSIKENTELKSENETNEQSARVFDLAIKLEGTIRSHGVHAAGVIIAPKDLVEYVPLEMAQKGVIATQYSMGPVEDIGLLKIDFLGLSNLTIIKNALRIIKKVYGEDIDIGSIPLDDKKTFELFRRAETTGVFQFESAGMKRYLKQLKPTQFDDLIAMNALYRPGPMQWIEDFIARKHGQKQIKYLHPAMKATLESTYGIIVYQEQVMQISKDLAGFSGSQADTLRKGIGKKIPEVLAKMKKEFIDGAVKKSNADRKLMEQFWGQLEDFAAYCFNKSHAACYALIAYQTAYLKANYPDAFMAALMTSDYDNIDRLAIEINECKHMGIEVLSPDVNYSFHEFSITPGENKIRFGLDAIKNVGHGAAEEILRARQEAGGQFTDLSQYCQLVNCRVVNRKSLESLVKAGALDKFGDRSLLANNIDALLNMSSKLQKDSNSGQVDLFGEGAADEMMPKLIFAEPVIEYTQAEQLVWERELLGLYLSHNPLEAYESILAIQTKPIAAITSESDGKMATVGGVISQIREITTKKGAKMAFVRLADSTGEIEVIVFPKAYSASPEMWQRDNIILAKGRVDFSRSDEPKILIEEAKIITDSDADENSPKDESGPAAGSIGEDIKKRLYIRLEDSSDQPLLLRLKEKLEGHHGQTEVVLVAGESAKKQIIKLPQTIDLNEESLRDMAALFGSTNVIVR